MKKVSKSFQAIVATTIVGILIPKLVEITGVQLFDKLIIKILLSSAFFVATVAVGLLYNFGVLKNRKEGGKARIVIYLLIVTAIFGSTASILSFIQSYNKGYYKRFFSKKTCVDPSYFEGRRSLLHNAK